MLYPLTQCLLNKVNSPASSALSLLESSSSWGSVEESALPTAPQMLGITKRPRSSAWPLYSAPSAFTPCRHVACCLCCRHSRLKTLKNSTVRQGVGVGVGKNTIGITTRVSWYRYLAKEQQQFLRLEIFCMLGVRMFKRSHMKGKQKIPRNACQILAFLIVVLRGG